MATKPESGGLVPPAEPVPAETPVARRERLAPAPLDDHGRVERTIDSTRQDVGRVGQEHAETAGELAGDVGR